MYDWTTLHDFILPAARSGHEAVVGCWLVLRAGLVARPVAPHAAGWVGGGTGCGTYRRDRLTAFRAVNNAQMNRGYAHLGAVAHDRSWRVRVRAQAQAAPGCEEVRP
ncbi:hypothetical protein CHLRE_11g481082v5 [Chlamydomonas reinhardtii]|uniref:Uncharacterized protein n=1 Tax=Chlamydomonas reinhardtii TaxID=3055 RepID=A0A2K3D8P4_CHLRE|nr:uncharacterized protein CHLRE_11g481082v5 [Chlamydomonas reinhardtii]PNW76911.1 hypothetical protein CHLRE_11g481082v5 [Chlamydomonas reinhardtii]